MLKTLPFYGSLTLMQRKCFKHFIIFFVILLLCTTAVVADDNKPVPELKDIIVTTSNSHLLLFATVLNSFTQEMVTGVQNGLSITFVFHVELKKIRNNWMDSTMVNTKIIHTMSYDSLKQKYRIQRSNKPDNDILTDSLKNAKERMAELSGIKIIHRDQLQPDSPYSVGLKATLEKNTLPLGMHYVLPFTSLWDFETDWRIIEFRY